MLHSIHQTTIMDHLAEWFSSTEGRAQIFMVVLSNVFHDLLWKLTEYTFPIIVLATLKVITNHTKNLLSIKIYELGSQLVMLQLHVLAESLHYQSPEVIRCELDWSMVLMCKVEGLYQSVCGFLWTDNFAVFIKRVKWCKQLCSLL